MANFMGDGFAPSVFGGIATALFVVAFAFGGTEIVFVAAAETAEPTRSVKKAVRTVLWRILVFYIGAIFVIAAVVPVGSEGLKSPFAAVLEAAGMPGGRARPFGICAGQLAVLLQRRRETNERADVPPRKGRRQSGLRDVGS